MLKKYTKQLLCLLVSCVSNSVFAVDQEKPTNFTIKLSADNKIGSSQEVSSDIAFSVLSGLAYSSNKYDLNDNIAYRAAFGYLSFVTALTHHEIGGHGFKAREFKGKIKKITINAFGGEASSSTPKPYHIQKDLLISLAGNDSNYLLGQKIANSWVYNSCQIDPILSFGYIFTQGNQLFYSYLKKSEPGHDLEAYVRYNEGMYGDKSVSIKKIRNIAWLDALDPILFATSYSALTGVQLEVPMIKIQDNIGLLPFARMIPTPYGVIEKKIGAYIITDYTPIKIGFSFGKQSKTTKAVTPTIQELQRLKDLHLENVNIPTIGSFTGLGNETNIKQYSTYSFDISVVKIFEVDQFIFGADAAFWSQPELFVLDPYRAKPKNGWFAMLNTSYNLSEDYKLIARTGYKTKGFVPGQHIAKTALFSLGFEWIL